MATDKQIAANRLNALGLYSHTFIIKTEDEQVFQNFSAGFVDEFKPQTPSELELLEQLISIAWRRHRLAGLINQRVNNAIDTTAAQCAHTVTPTETAPDRAAPLDPIHITLLAYEKLEDEKPFFARQEAQETRLYSLFQRTLSRLQQSRKNAEQQKIRNEACTFLLGRLNSSQSVTCQGAPNETRALSTSIGHVPLVGDTQRELQ